MRTVNIGINAIINAACPAVVCPIPRLNNDGQMAKLVNPEISKAITPFGDLGNGSRNPSAIVRAIIPASMDRNTPADKASM